MPLPTGALSISTVATAYGVPSDMNSLRNKTYYNANGTLGTSQASGPIDLGQFLGVYTSELISTLASQERYGNSDFNLSNIQLWIGFNLASYAIHGTRLASLSLNFYWNHQHGGTAVSSGTYGESAYIVVDGTTYPGGSGQRTYTGLNGASTLTIHVNAGASNNIGANIAMSREWYYTISDTGLTYTGYYDQY